MTGNDVVDRVRIYMNDLVEDYRWDSTASILPFICDGQRQIAQLVKGSYTLNGLTTLVEGTKQELPICAIKLYRVVRNMGIDGLVPGDVITNVPLDEFQVLDTGLHADDADAACQYAAYDPRDPKHYYVYPPQPSSDQGKVELSMAAIPEDPSTVSATLGLDDEYLAPLAMYATAQLMMTETEENAPAKAAAMMNKFYTEIKGIGAAALPEG